MTELPPLVSLAVGHLGGLKTYERSSARNVAFVSTGQRVLQVPLYKLPVHEWKTLIAETLAGRAGTEWTVPSYGWRSCPPGLSIIGSVVDYRESLGVFGKSNPARTKNGCVDVVSLQEGKSIRLWERRNRIWEEREFDRKTVRLLSQLWDLGLGILSDPAFD